MMFTLEQSYARILVLAALKRIMLKLLCLRKTRHYFHAEPPDMNVEKVMAQAV